MINYKHKSDRWLKLNANDTHTPVKSLFFDNISTYKVKWKSLNRSRYMFFHGTGEQTSSVIIHTKLIQIVPTCLKRFIINILSFKFLRIEFINWLKNHRLNISNLIYIPVYTHHSSSKLGGGVLIGISKTSNGTKKSTKMNFQIEKNPFY